MHLRDTFSLDRESKSWMSVYSICLFWTMVFKVTRKHFKITYECSSAGISVCFKCMFLNGLIAILYQGMCPLTMWCYWEQAGLISIFHMPVTGRRDFHESQSFIIWIRSKYIISVTFILSGNALNAVWTNVQMDL